MSFEGMTPFGEIFKITDGRVEEFARSAFVKSMTADKVENKITAVIYSERVFELCEIRAAEAAIAERYRLNRALLLPNYPKSLLNDEYFEFMDRRLRDEFPSVTGYLCGAEWRYNDGKLNLVLKNGLNGFFDACVKYIKSAVEAEFSVFIEVEVENGFAQINTEGWTPGQGNG